LKSGKITLYLIIGLVLLILISGFFSFRNKESTDELKQEVDEKASLTGLRGNAKQYIDDCLAQSTIKAIDFIGILDTEELIENYINLKLLNCLDDFDNFKVAGYDVSFEKPVAKVTINDEQVFVELLFPVVLSTGKEYLSLNEYQYRFNTKVTQNTPNGLLKSGTTLLSEDKDFVLKVESDTKVKDNYGNNVESFSIKTQDKHFQNLDNSVVIGQIAYEGDPNGLHFDPAVKVQIRIDKQDIPFGYGNDDPKVGWYDKSSDIWRTYQSCGVTEDKDYVYYCGLVDHFTPIAVVTCGTSTQGQFHVQMNYVYESPIQAIVDEQGKSEELTWTEDNGKMYLSDSQMKNAHCMFLDELKGESSGETVLQETEETSDEVLSNAPDHIKKYNVEYLFDGEVKTNFDKCEFMMQDWSGEDQEDKLIDKLSDCFFTEEIGCRDQILNIVNYKNLIPSNDIKKLFGTENPTNEQLFEFFYDGDGIKDGSEAVISCDVTTVTKCKIDGDPVATYNTYGFEKTTHDNLQALQPVNFEEKEYKKDEIAEYVGGYGIFKFELRGEGGSCIDESTGEIDEEVVLYPKLLEPVYLKDDLPDGVDNCLTGKGGDDGYKPEKFEGDETCGGNVLGEFKDEIVIKNLDGNGISCSTGDSCFWQINPEREEGDINNKLRGGENFVSVIVQNGVDDANAYATGLLEIKGTGIKGQSVEECDGTTLQQRLNYFNGCGGTNNKGLLTQNMITAENAKTSSYLAQLCIEVLGLDIGRSTELCSITDNDITKAEEISYYKLDDGTPIQCEYFKQDMTDGYGRGGYCKDGEMICPGKVTPGMDNNCLCGSESYDGKKTQYCCDGSFSDTGCNLQISPIALKSPSSVALANGGQGGGSGSKICGKTGASCLGADKICCVTENQNNPMICVADLSQCYDPNDRSGNFVNWGALGTCEENINLDTFLASGGKDCLCNGNRISQNELSTTNEIVCCNIDGTISIMGSLSQCTAEASSVTTLTEACILDGDSIASCNLICNNLQTDVSSDLVTNLCGKDSVSGKQMKCCIDNSVTDVCCETRENGNKKISLSECISQGKINPFIAPENCEVDQSKDICCVNTDGSREFVPISSCHGEGKFLNTILTDQQSCEVDGTITSSGNGIDNGNTGTTFEPDKLTGVGQECGRINGANVMCPWIAPDCVDSSNKNICDTHNSNRQNIDYDYSFRCDSLSLEDQKKFPMVGCFCGETYGVLGEPSTKYCINGEFSSAPYKAQETNNKICCIYPGFAATEGQDGKFCTIMSESGYYEPVTENDCRQNYITGEVLAEFEVKIGEGIDCSDPCGPLVPHAESDSYTGYCSGNYNIGTDSVPNYVLSVDDERSNQLFPIDSKVCKGRDRYTCTEHQTWIKTDCLYGDSDTDQYCVDPKDGNAYCSFGVTCTGSAGWFTRPDLEGERGSMVYGKDCKVCQNEGKEVDICASKNNWDVETSCDFGCYETYDCEAKCREDLGVFVGCLGSIQHGDTHPGIENKVFNKGEVICGRNNNLYTCTESNTWTVEECSECRASIKIEEVRKDVCIN
jgi:hypothetical protein